MSFIEQSECTVDRVVEELYRVVVSDGALGENGTTPPSYEAAVATMKSDIANQLVEAKKMYEEGLGSTGKRLRMLTLREMTREMQFREVLQLVRSDTGAFNWLLLNASVHGTEIANAGGGGVEEMCNSLESDQVYFGLVRMGFGKGVFRRCKLIFIHYSGEDVNALRRGKLNAEEESMRRIVGSVNLSQFAATREELNLSDLIERVKNTTLLDGEANDNASDLYSLESYMVAVEEDSEAMKREFADEIVVETTNEENGSSEKDKVPPLGEALESIRSRRQPWNWLLCEL